MSPLHLRKHLLAPGAVALFLVAGAGLISRAHAGQMSFTPGKDNTLYSFDYSKYDPTKPSTLPASDGSGISFSAGWTGGQKTQIQRGLIQFDLSALPSGANIISVSLDLYVTSVPARAYRDNLFWLVAVTGLSQPWGEGGSNDTNTFPQPPDATWFHSQYDPSNPGTPASHVDAAGKWKPFAAGAAGFWPEHEGYLGADRLQGTEPFLSPASSQSVGRSVGYVTWSTSQMLADVQQWASNPGANFGWIVVGEEWIQPVPEQSDPSSKREFCSREDTRIIDGRSVAPKLTVTYTDVPEPAAWLLCLSGAVAVGGYLARRT